MKKNLPKLAVFFGIVGFFSVFIGLVIAYAYGWDNYRAEREQPIDYSHYIHVKLNNMKCTDCHTNVDRGAHAGVPSMAKCMECHVGVGAGKPGVEKLKKMWNNKEVVEWKRVHNIPKAGMVHFTHKRHVKYFMPLYLEKWFLEQRVELFTLENAPTEDLEDETPPEWLVKFFAQKGISLSEDSTLEAGRGDQWILTDGDKRYILALEKVELKIYETLGLKDAKVMAARYGKRVTKNYDSSQIKDSLEAQKLNPNLVEKVSKNWGTFQNKSLKQTCYTCHGKVEYMGVPRKVSPLKMGWCVTCHVKHQAPRDCSTCHK